MSEKKCKLPTEVPPFGSPRAFALKIYREADLLPPGKERDDLYKLAGKAQKIADRRDGKWKTEG